MGFPNLGGSISTALNDFVGSAKANIEAALGLPSSATKTAGSAGKGSTPWEASAVNSRFFSHITIDGSRWDQLFPYRLIVIDAQNKNQVVNGSAPANIKTTITPGTSSAIVSFTNFNSQWIFQLPISPTQLNIADQFAINTSATLRGFLEEHSGVRFKMITAAGTMGVWPGRPSITDPPTSPSILGSVFGGSLTAVGNLFGQVQGLINTVSTGHPASQPITQRPQDSHDGYNGTGQYQAQALQQFLEQYAEAKRNPANAGWRLILDIPKQNQSFVVTPMAFNWIQNANKPMEISYNIQLKAWRRIDLKESTTPGKSSVTPISPGVLAKILNSISQARQVCSSAINLIGAVRSDVEAPLNALRQAALFVKDLAGVGATAADLPLQLQKDYANAIRDAINILQLIGTGYTNPKAAEAAKFIRNSIISVEGLSMAAVANGQLGNAAAHTQTIDPANNVFNKPEAYFDLFDGVQVSDLVLTPAQHEAVNNVIADAQTTTVDNLKTYRATIQQLALQLSNNFGTGSAFYNKIYGLPAPTTRIQPMTLDEFDILRALYDSIQSIDILTATTDVDFLNKQTNMDYIAGLADLAGIQFQTSTSKALAPVPFGLTVEAIAARYLADPQRWLEIVTLNNLKAPYIDENGFQMPLLSNATGRQITIATIENLYIGQTVIMRSATQTPSARHILNIDTLSATSHLITLDGLANLDNFTLSDLSYLQAYLPGTVNSQQKIFIPSDLPVPNDPNIQVPASTANDPLTGLSKVDFLLTDSGDLALNNFGDLRLASGMTNIIQALKIKVGTQLGTVLLHPDFGLGVKVGSMTSEFSTNDIFSQLNKMIQADSRFQGIDTLQVTLNGPVLSINMGVLLAGRQGIFPINFNLVV